MNTSYPVKLEWIEDGVICTEAFGSALAACTFLASHNKYGYKMTGISNGPTPTHKQDPATDCVGPCSLSLSYIQADLSELSDCLVELEARLALVLSQPKATMGEKLDSNCLTFSCDLESMLAGKRSQLREVISLVRSLTERIQL